jgi:hypothetical protein
MLGNDTAWSRSDAEGDGQFDYRTLTKEEIEYALQHIDGSRFPMNLANARAALEARNSGASPEPAPILDEATDERYTYRAEKLLGLLIAAYAAIALSFDDLAIPYWGNLHNSSMRGAGVIHLHGSAAWMGALAMVLFAAIPFFGGLGDSDNLAIIPRFKYVYRAAVVVLLAAIVVSYLSQSAHGI